MHLVNAPQKSQLFSQFLHCLRTTHHPIVRYIAALVRYIARDGLAHRRRQQFKEDIMEMKHGLSAAVGCVALVLSAMPATAAPISGITSNPQVAANAGSIIETTHWRRYEYYYSEIPDDSFERYYPYEEPSYRYSYIYPSYDTYYVYPRYRYYHHHHHHHRHFRHYPHYRHW
jgi:hypothetical protein